MASRIFSKKSKKAMIFNITLVLLTIVVLIYAFIRLSDKTDVHKEIGESPMELIAKIQEGEKALIFLDFASKMAIYQAVYDLQSQGGVAESGSCGMYYGFNRWNAEAGQVCFVDSSTAKNSLRDLFVSNLVARVAAYPSADFVGNVPTAAMVRGIAAATGDQIGVSVDVSGAERGGCAQEDVMADFTYGSDSDFFPENGGRLWVPREASCEGSYPLIVFLHGCMRQTHATPHADFGTGTPNDIIPLARRLIQSNRTNPVILAAPSQIGGDATYQGVPNSPCGESLWGSSFDPAQFVEVVRSRLPTGVQIGSVSFVGHGEAGCSVNTGIHRATATVGNMFAVGQFDSCANSVLGRSLREKLGADTKFLAVYSSLGVDRGEHNSAMALSNPVDCPAGELAGGSLSECFSAGGGRFFGFTMQDSSAGSHGNALLVGMEQFLKAFFSDQGITVADQDAEDAGGSQ